MISPFKNITSVSTGTSSCPLRRGGLKRIYLTVFVLFTMNQSMAAALVCQPILWPASSAILNPSFIISKNITTTLKKSAEKILSKSSHPMSVLGSAGKTSINDPTLIETRVALKDADNAAVSAITYRLTHQVMYLDKTKDILLSWAKKNHPTGHPIDETRLDGMIWAYDLVSCDLSFEDKSQILVWFEQMRAKKVAWTFGPLTSRNNHRIHQIKMLLLLDKILSRDDDWQQDINIAKKYSTINLNQTTGISIDYLQRNALYYHNYVMQPWLEISLLSGCCQEVVKKGYEFLSNKITSHQIGPEFLNSSAKIDALRAHGGFIYAKTGGMFDVTKASPTIVLYYTMVREKPNPTLWRIQEQEKKSPKMTFLEARRLLWES